MIQFQMQLAKGIINKNIKFPKLIIYILILYLNIKNNSAFHLLVKSRCPLTQVRCNRPQRPLAPREALAGTLSLLFELAEGEAAESSSTSAEISINLNSSITSERGEIAVED